MTLRKYLRTSDLAKAGRIGVQQVRNYEAMGLLPPVQRSPKGYRLYTLQHLAALKAVQRMIPGYGWQRTPQIMQALHCNDVAGALAFIDASHGEIANKRLQAERTLAALQALALQSALPHGHQTQRLYVGEAAKQVGVRVSAVHFWEQQGLLHPLRDKESRYRLYDEQQMNRLRVVVLLREAGYDFKIIHPLLDELAAGRPEKAIVAVEKRREDLARTSWLCLEALAVLHSYIQEFCTPLPFYHEQTKTVPS